MRMYLLAFEGYALVIGAVRVLAFRTLIQNTDATDILTNAPKLPISK